MPPRTTPRALPFVTLALGAAFVGVATWNAWVCDDAYITFRTADNLLHGLGPRWNAAERVQAYTHPAWLFVVAAAATVTREFYFTSIVLGIALSAAALWIFARRVVPAGTGACLALLGLALSRACTDYATAGLENPLAHVLLAAFLAAYWRRAGRVAAAGAGLAWAALALCNRLDAVWLLAPAATVLLLELPPAARWPTLVRALSPLVAWAAFALFYYGALLPNSAVAKLATAFPMMDLARRGLDYLVASGARDPVGALVVAAGLAAPFVQRDRRGMALAAGILAHLLWVVRVGGDFMSGRLLTPCVFVAAALLGRARWDRRAALAFGAACVVLGAAATWRARSQDALPGLAARTLDAHGIADERAFYERLSGLRHARRDIAWPDPATAAMAADLRRDWLADPFLDVLFETGLLAANDSLPASVLERVRGGIGHPVVLRAAVGTFGFDIGPGVHVLDLYALGDPLRARLPALRHDPLVPRFLPSLAAAGWRPGHYLRRVPAGYVATLASGENHLADPDLARYWDDLAAVTRGPLFASRRWGALMRLQRGAHDPRLRRYAARAAAEAP